MGRFYRIGAEPDEQSRDSRHAADDSRYTSDSVALSATLRLDATVEHMDRSNRSMIQWECQQLLNRVTNLIDSRQWGALVDCYLEDGVLFRPSDPDNGIVGRQAILQSLQERPPGITCHLLANSEFDVLSAVHVVARSRVWLANGPPEADGPVEAKRPLLIGSFVDTLVYRDARWLIAERKGSIELKLA